MKILISSLVLIFFILQYQLWLGEDSVRALNLLEVDLDAQHAINSDLEDRNRLLEIEVIDLKGGLEAVEERALSQLGMIGEDEVFYLIIE